MSQNDRTGGGKRPYFKHSVAQLEKLFELGRTDAALLQSLDRELSFRSTERATRLRRRIATLGTSRSAGPGTGPAPDLTARLMPARPGAAPPATAQRSPTIGPAASPAPPSPFPAPKGENEPGAILGAWTALEALSPQTYRRPEDMAGGDRSCVATFENRPLPWETGERSRPNKQLYYQVILGAIPMARATERMVAAFGADEERGTLPRDQAAIAAILVDRYGVPLSEKGTAVSSFAWALPIALKGDLGALGGWPTAEPAAIAGLERILQRRDRQGKPVPLDAATIGEAYRWLVAQFGLPADLVEPPSFALRVYHYYRAKTAPEAALLNSFFMGDLNRAAGLVSKGEAPAGLRRYLGIDRPDATVDLLADHAALEQAAAPAAMPAARWPSPGGYPLVLLQQAAVNLARSELAGKEGVIAVNGPPGTGKTTLLRDLVAACVLDRALAMASFDDPDQAFTPSGQKIAVGDRAFLLLYSLAPSLKGHEVLVASSNNKAVENISRELPGLKAIGRSPEELGYFRSVSDLMHAPKAPEAMDVDDPQIGAEPAETWGMIAAVLGNRANLAAFQQSFWWHDDRSFRLYLKAAKGDTVVTELRHPQTGAIVERRTPTVVAEEKPPTPDQAKANWRGARQKLLALKQEIDAELIAIERVRRLCVELGAARQRLAADETSRVQAVAGRAAAANELLISQARLRGAQQAEQQSAAAVDTHRRERPYFWSALVRTKAWRSWSRVHKPLLDATARASTALQEVQQAMTQATTALDGASTAIAASDARVKQGQQNVARLSTEIETHRPRLGDRLLGEEFWTRSHEQRHLTSPWLPDDLNRKREALFAAALQVHRAFIDASARKIYHNLGALMDTLSNAPPADDPRRKLIGDLWSTLFLTVPVVSTTFASVDRMMGALPTGSIGWLLIDEAGQALPQAAVGAVLRAKRTVVVGDPLQIPPVVTLPQQLTYRVCRHFKVDPAKWAAPETSAQTVADRASGFQGQFRSPSGPRRVGIPLLTHRRCQEPMFGIFNRIAYDDQMVQATTPTPGQIGAVLCPSHWLDIDGPADSKWCPAEGEATVSLLKQLAAAGVTKPDLFIVTPFRMVAQELRHRLEQERTLFASLDLDARQWTRDRVGTIHTVQGREADAVILILGAPSANQTGARSWAASTPNIFNVAVSRARQNLYVIGSRGVWSGIGHGRELAALPMLKPRSDAPDNREPTTLKECGPVLTSSSNRRPTPSI